MSCLSCLYILVINFLSVVSFAIIFSHSEDCLFTLFIVCFAVQKLLDLVRSHFFFFPPLLLEMVHRGSCCDLYHMLSSKSFIVSDFILIFKFIFLYGVMKCFNFFLLHVAVQFYQHYLLKRLSFLHCIFLPLLSRIRCPLVCGFISGFSMLLH